MKTFETEKHSIPEGATHYSNENDTDVFAWFKSELGVNYIWCPGINGEEYWISLVDQCEMYGEDVTPIPQTNIETPEERESKWKSGDKCIFVGEEYTFGCVNPICDQGSVVIFDDSGDYHGCCIDELSKPETTQQREERERLESAYDLYLIGNDSFNLTTRKSISEFKVDDFQRDFWLAIVDKTNYRKEG
ncbi:hypothetical protein NVP1113A_72 [Vibrio phage 1.113.A._10N.286.51.E7]|nr:hypothetical protein NVP1113A_72 [Vibrio phage 1.113.A._10N.286.51.E7]